LVIFVDQGFDLLVENILRILDPFNPLFKLLGDLELAEVQIIPINGALSVERQRSHVLRV